MAAPPLPPLSAVDPASAWKPWEPSAADPWNLKWAGHLYRRLAFSGTRAELREALRVGYRPTLDRLLNGEPDAEARDHFLTETGAGIAKGGDATQLRGWWVYALLNTRHPFREKMTLFWHNHFATSIAKVQDAQLMYRQNRLLHRNALAKFEPLLLAVGQDPAMLIWLDSDSNVKGKPNENYARELMELFSLGVGHYSEKDVREAARAFTGRRNDGEEYFFDADEHDAGPKTVLGRTGNWTGDDVVRIVLEQPAAPRFIVRKLYRYLISEVDSPPDSLLQPLADEFRKSGFDVAALARTMASSRHFFSSYAYRRRVKSPVELAVGAARTVVPGPVPPTLISGQLEPMGQELFAPPNVKGWPGGQSWLNTATVLARHNFAGRIARGNFMPDQEGQPQVLMAPTAPAGPGKVTIAEPAPPFDAAAIVRQEKLTAPDQVVVLLLDNLLQGDVAPKARARLTAFLSEGKPAGKDFHHRVRETGHAIMSMPEYQLA